MQKLIWRVVAAIPAVTTFTLMVPAAPAMAQQAIQQDPQTEFVGTLAKLYYKAIGDNAQLNAMVTSLRAENEKLKAPATPAPAAPEAPK